MFGDYILIQLYIKIQIMFGDYILIYIEIHVIFYLRNNSWKPYVYIVFTTGRPLYSCIRI
jgi:hypothetical protein